MPISENVSSEREHLDCVAMNIIVSALDSNELLKVSECRSAKEMWNTLEEYHKNPRSALMEKEEFFAESFLFRPVDRDVFVRGLNRQLRSPSH